uniref:AlNc14C341G10799 protein n=1 Tax=Albugo laibachii Nc14 TaxID=890382 RepID=F0WX42_9STRA|nr:AlNc14C341G10799 [Albugo laibachii Nc14]|eukprot:CCA26031.1 AlNc14C341G10799 [Albugo laibachii Nc14]
MCGDDKWCCGFVSCKIQTGVSLSTMEVGFIAASHAGRELLRLRQLFLEQGIKIAEPMKMRMENQAGTKQLESEKSTASAKHVDICFKFICQYAHAQAFQPIFAKPGEMIADLLTKALAVPRIAELRDMFKLIIMHTNDQICFSQVMCARSNPLRGRIKSKALLRMHVLVGYK